MILTYKYRLKLRSEQEKRITQWIGTCRYIYNIALYLKKDAYSKSISLSFNDLQKQLTTIKDVDWIADVPSQSLQATIQKLERAYQNFFKRGAGSPKKPKKEAGLPKKSKRRAGFPRLAINKRGLMLAFQTSPYYQMELLWNTLCF